MNLCLIFSKKILFAFLFKIVRSTGIFVASSFAYYYYNEYIRFYFDCNFFILLLVTQRIFSAWWLLLFHLPLCCVHVCYIKKIASVFCNFEHAFARSGIWFCWRRVIRQQKLQQSKGCTKWVIKNIKTTIRELCSNLIIIMIL